jgi:hypothetical protein
MAIDLTTYAKSSFVTKIKETKAVLQVGYFEPGTYEVECLGMDFFVARKDQKQYLTWDFKVLRSSNTAKDVDPKTGLVVGDYLEAAPVDSIRKHSALFNDETDRGVSSLKQLKLFMMTAQNAPQDEVDEGLCELSAVCTVLAETWSLTEEDKAILKARMGPFKTAREELEHKTMLESLSNEIEARERLNSWSDAFKGIKLRLVIYKEKKQKEEGVSTRTRWQLL